MGKITIAEFDFANENNISKALLLLNKAFPEANFTRNWWDWKYKDTPFGKPLGWIAEVENYENLAGLRLLWPWSFYKNNEKKTIYQVCDAATDPKFYRQGIMTKITDIAAKQVEKNNSCLYGFPNPAKTFSYQTYHKLGAIDLGRIKWHVYPVNLNPFHLIKKVLQINRTSNKNIPRKYSIQNFNTEIITANNHIYATKWTNKIINWRFKKSPIQKYYFYERNNNVIIYKITNRKSFKEAQILLSSINSCDFIKQFSFFLKDYDFDLISYNALNTDMIKYFEKLMFSFKHKSFITYLKIDHANVINDKIRIELAEMDFT